MDEFPQPPNAESARAYVEAAWNAMQKKIYDAIPFEMDLVRVDEYLANRDSMLKANRLAPGFAWDRDLWQARWLHDFYKSWVPVHQGAREATVQTWIDNNKQAREYVDKIGTSAFNTMILVHGAVAIGALNALAQDPKELAPMLVGAAKLVLGGALVGITLLLLGQLIIFIHLAPMVGTVRNHLAGRFKFSKIDALRRYWNRYMKRVDAGAYLIYGSIGWFVFYSSAAFIMLLGG